MDSYSLAWWRMPLILEMILEGGWRSALVGIVAIAGVAANSFSPLRRKFLPLVALSLALALLFTVEAIAQALLAATRAPSPGGSGVTFVGATLEGLGPLIVALVGAIVASVSAIARGEAWRPGKDAASATASTISA